MTLKINNRDARRLWLSAQGLALAPTGPLDVLQIISDLGYVQLDSIQNVSRAHHHILWSRNQKYREAMFDPLMSEERVVFEHYGHDASVFPMEFYPVWTRQFRRLKARFKRNDRFPAGLDKADMLGIKTRVAEEGPLSTHAFDTKVTGKKKMWTRPPHKQALDYLWYSGELTTSHREGFTKFYALTEHVIPEEIRKLERSDEEQIDRLCRGALERLTFGTESEIRRFFDAVNQAEVKRWLKDAENDVRPVEVQAVDGSLIKAYAPGDIEKRVVQSRAPTSRMRLLNPFDPVVRDRKRLSRLFGFDYTIEIFVPAAKRKWGYYVYPLLEGDRFVGRIEVKADRKAGSLDVIAFWPEDSVTWGSKRYDKLDAELNRLARFIGAEEVNWR